MKNGIQRHRRRSLYVGVLYVWAMLREFRWTLIALALVLSMGTVLYSISVDPDTHRRTPLGISMYGAWMAMLAQPVGNPTEHWYLTLMCAIYPLLGAVLIGEGVVRLAMLMVSRRRGEKEWIRIMASTYRDHVVLCGLGNLGLKVLEQFVASGASVVVLERSSSARNISKAKELGVPVLIRDMKEDQALIDAGIKHARAVVIATNDPLASIEVALDAKRMNPDIRVLMRMYDEQVASKLSAAVGVDVAFSSSSLAAPVIAALALQNNANRARVISSMLIDGVPHVAAEISVAPDSAMVGQKIGDLESSRRFRVLARGAKGSTRSATTGDAVVNAGDSLVVHVPAAELEMLK